MIRIKVLSVLRPLGRVVLLIILGYPHLIIAVPLSAWLLVFVISGWLRPDTHQWTTTELLRGAGMTVAAVLFAVLVITYLISVVYVGWKGHGDVYRRGSWEAVGRPWLHCVISRAGLLKRLDDLGRSRRLVGPVRREEPRCTPPRRYYYEQVSRAGDLALDFDYAVYGPKPVVLPPRETLFRFDARDGRFQAITQDDSRPTVLAGVHPCDVHALRLLDEAFRQDHRDQHYYRRRDKLLIVALDCPSPCHPSAFCRDMQSNAADTGFDVMLYPLDSAPTNGRADKTSGAQRYGVVLGSDAGREWLMSDDHQDVRWPTTDDERVFERYLMRKADVFPRRLTSGRREIPAVLSRTYNSLVWDATAQRCYSCGSCNLVCPTCYCFDIQDRNDLPVQCGERERLWDSCMLRDFAVVAGGHNFRVKCGHRLRHRIHRKGAWIERRTGLSGCVGCGRCERACTAHISIVDILNQLAHENEGADRSRVAPAVAPAGGAS